MLTNISDHELVAKIRDLVVLERRVTRQLLHHIGEMEKRRCYTSLGFSSAFDFLTREFGYSESAAWRRIQAARLLRSVPEASAKIETGELNLTTLAQTQTAIKAEEKRTGEKLTGDRKANVVAQIESCSSREVERSLTVIFPDIDRGGEAKDLVRSVDENHVRAHVTLTRGQLEKLERLKEILSHRDFGGSLADVIEAAADELLERKDPLRKTVKSRTTGRNSAAQKDKPMRIAVATEFASSDTGAGGASQKTGGATKKTGDITKMAGGETTTAGLEFRPFRRRREIGFFGATKGSVSLWARAGVGAIK